MDLFNDHNANERLHYDIVTPDPSDPEFITKAEATLHKLHKICEQQAGHMARGHANDKLVNSVHKLSKTLHDLVMTYELIQNKKGTEGNDIPYHIPLPWEAHDK